MARDLTTDTIHGAPATQATAATTYVTMGVAPGDGDLLYIPPRFSGDRKAVAEVWIQDLLDYVQIRNVPKSTAMVLLCARLTGVARKWLEIIPPGATFDGIVRRFRQRFGTNDTSRTEMLTEFWHRRQAQKSKKFHGCLLYTSPSPRDS